MKPLQITSPSNHLIKHAIDVRDRRKRSGVQSIFVEGPHLVETALMSGAPVLNLFYTSSFLGHGEGRRLVRRVETASRAGRERAAERGGRSPVCVEVSEGVMSVITETRTPQGVAAVVAFEPVALSGLPLSRRPLIAVCDGVQDPGNLGTIIRTADAAAADAVVLMPGTCDAFTAKSIRATAGSIFNVPVIQCPLSDLGDLVSSAGLTLYVTEVHTAASIYGTDLSVPLALVFGSEARGVSPELRRIAAGAVGVPIYGKAESLNVALTAAICLYEAVRQRKMPGRHG